MLKSVLHIFHSVLSLFLAFSLCVCVVFFESFYTWKNVPYFERKVVVYLDKSKKQKEKSRTNKKNTHIYMYEWNE